MSAGGLARTAPSLAAAVLALLAADELDASARLLPAGASGTGAVQEPFPREPVEGTTLRRVLEFEAELTLAELAVEVDGEPLPVEAELDVELAESWRVVVEDDLGPPARGRPRTLVRWFEELSGARTRTTGGPDGGGEAERELGGGLEGCSVRFELEVEDTEPPGAGPGEPDGYRVRFEDEPCDEALLDYLREDLDLRALLPEPGAELEQGDSWELPPRALLALLDPGGVAPRPLDETELERRLRLEAREQLEGDGRATWLGRREGPDGEVSVVALELTLTTRASGPVATEDEARVEFEETEELVLEGELAWSVAGGHLGSLDLAGTCERVELLRASVAGGEREQRTRLAGEASLRVRVERSE